MDDSLEKIVIDKRDTDTVQLASGERGRETAPLSSPIDHWVKAAMAPLVLVLPILCLVALVIRIATRALPPRTRFAWLSFLSSLLICSGILTSAASVVALTWAPHRVPVSLTLAELDTRSLPALPAAETLDGRKVSQLLRPLVAVVSPPLRTWLGAEGPSSSFGAAVLLTATPAGYLFVTAKHVVGDAPSSTADHAFVSFESGAWAMADLVARHSELDLALFWLPRGTGAGSFALPVVPRSGIEDGENIFVIGHPEGLRFTLSTGIVSRADDRTIQISAPVSPGNSGGPVFDDRGELVAVVTSMIGRGGDPNAENLNFSVPADAVLTLDGWRFAANGRQRLQNSLQFRASLSSKEDQTRK